MSFATVPEDLEKNLFLESGGAEQASIGQWDSLNETCRKYGSKVVAVLDAEGEIVCLAPVEIARLIVTLMNESDAIS